jgi:hypothetical protein
MVLRESPEKSTGAITSEANERIGLPIAFLNDGTPAGSRNVKILRSFGSTSLSGTLSGGWTGPITYGVVPRCRKAATL